MIENYRQNDDAYIGYAIQLSGYVVLTFSGAIAAIVGLSVGLVTGIGFFVVLVGLLTVAFIFPEDSHIEFWLANGPFAQDESLCWNSASYIERQESIITKDSNGRRERKDCTMHYYDGFVLAVDEAGNLADVFHGSMIESWQKLRIEKDNKVYLKAGKHPLVKKDTLIGIIGKPYTPVTILEPQIAARFMGHTHGADPMTHVPASKPGLFFKSTPNPDQQPEYRCAMWCEYPDQAYASLMDSLYRHS